MTRIDLPSSVRPFERTTPKMSKSGGVFAHFRKNKTPKAAHKRLPATSGSPSTPLTIDVAHNPRTSTTVSAPPELPAFDVSPPDFDVPRNPLASSDSLSETIDRNALRVKEGGRGLLGLYNADDTLVEHVHTPGGRVNENFREPSIEQLSDEYVLSSLTP